MQQLRRIKTQLLHLVGLISLLYSCILLVVVYSYFNEARIHERQVYSIVFFLLGDSPAYEFYVPTFRNTLSVQNKIQTSGNHPK